MCLISIAVNAHARFPFVIAANRDEYFARPTLPAHWWPEGFVAGKDLEHGGTWLGLGRNGRWAALTNIRRPVLEKTKGKSRGELVKRALLGEPLQSEEFADFNLLQGCFTNGRARASFLSTDAAEMNVADGFHALSNASINSHWPKALYLQRKLKESLSADANLPAIEHSMLKALCSQDVADDAALPDTGIGVDRERFLGPAFIRRASAESAIPSYGTRVSTFIAVDHDGNCHFSETTWDAESVAPKALVCRRFVWRQQASIALES